jgi:hypothetical protein
VLPLKLIPYADAATTPSVIVDGAAAAATRVTLSHWPGSPTPPELRQDLSAEIAFRALEDPARFDGLDAVSNNHYDQDGLASVYALVDPDAAVARRDRVIDVARAGDFGTFVDRDAARIAITLATYDDPSLSPLPKSVLDGPYDELCAALYESLVPQFTEMLDHPERWRSSWEREDAHLGESIDAITRGAVRIEERPAVDLAIVTVPDDWAARASHRFTQVWTEAVHPMAVDNATSRLRVLLVQGRRYRLECRYETWVMYVSQPIAPRPDLRPLADRLNEIDDARWSADAPGALTPQLRLDDNDESALAPEAFIATVEQYLATAPAAWDPFTPRRP